MIDNQRKTSYSLPVIGLPMVLISIDYHDLVSLLGRDMAMDELQTLLPMMGSDIDSVEGDSLNVEFFPNRPDLYSVEGVARALRGFLGFEKGLVEYPMAESGVVLNVDPSVNDVRPYIVAGMVRGVDMTGELIKSLMEVQEKLHLTLGRKRSKVAIGVLDPRSLKPPFVYKAVEPRSLSFVPLGYIDEMDMTEILMRHEKGREYAWILEGKDRYPIILDSKDEVLSFPPIINGVVTQVTEATTDLFLDLTGTDMNAVNSALNIIATLLAERGGRIETAEAVYPDRALTLPDLSPRTRHITGAEVNALLGTEYSNALIVENLEKMRYGASEAQKSIVVQVPAYRNDILHNVDLIEDIAIAAGFENIEGVLPRALTFGRELDIETLSGIARRTMIGFGYQEVKSLHLSSLRDQFDRMLRPEPSNVVKVANPISEDMDCARVSIVPCLLRFLQANKHRDLPQSVFEVGDVVHGEDTVRHLAALSMHPKASFTETKSLLQSLLRDLGLEMNPKPTGDPAYIGGRVAAVESDGKQMGNFGELHPQVLENFELGYPAAGFEVRLEINR
jgi:phenylalanyl-tRNA synthetase beta chain